MPPRVPPAVALAPGFPYPSGGGGGVITWEILAGPLLALLLGYALGATPFGFLLTRFAGLGDVRAIGSGNIGATNVLRTGRKSLAAATLLLDAAKGAAAVLIARWLWPGTGLEALAAIGAFFGHLYPAWLGFKGGKGAATLMGVLTALVWPVGLIFGAAWIATLLATRYASVASMVAAIAAPLAGLAFARFTYVLLFVGFALMVIWKHRANLARLRAGTEPRVGASKG
jgi:glycerol-3-phosphate acyltransferase PlsY